MTKRITDLTPKASMSDDDIIPFVDASENETSATTRKLFLADAVGDDELKDGAALANLGDTGWIPLELAAGFEPYAAADTPEIRRVGNMVQIRGAVKPTSTATSAQISTVPSEFRHTGMSLIFVCQGSSNERWAMTINSSTGRINFERYSGTVTTSIWLPFSVMYFVG